MDFGRTPLQNVTVPTADPRGQKERAEVAELLLAKGAGREGESVVALQMILYQILNSTRCKAIKDHVDARSLGSGLRPCCRLRLQRWSHHLHVVFLG